MHFYLFIVRNSLSLLLLLSCFSCVQLFCDLVDCSPPGSSVHRILQVRILEWVAVPFSRDLSDPGSKPASLTSPALEGGFITTRLVWEVCILVVPQIYLFHLSPLLHSYSGFQNTHLMKLNCNQSELC